MKTIQDVKKEAREMIFKRFGTEFNEKELDALCDLLIYDIVELSAKAHEEATRIGMAEADDSLEFERGFKSAKYERKIKSKQFFEEV